MPGYDIDEYEDLDEYEEEDEEEGEEQVEEDDEDEDEEARLRAQEELGYLEYRKLKKESIRKQMKRESGSALSSSQDKKPYDDFGSFFGPSQPFISTRVMEESKSFLENPRLVARVSKVNIGDNKNFTSTSVGSKPGANDHPPTVTSQLKSKSKIQMIKNTRDYSFLSDDAEMPAVTKDPSPRNVASPKSEAKMAPRTPNTTGRKAVNGLKEKKPMPIVNQMRVKAVSQKPASANKSNLASAESRKQLGSNNGSGPGRPSGPKCLPSKIPASSKEKVLSASSAKNSVPGARKPLPSKLQSSGPKQSLEQKKDYGGSSKGKLLPKQPMLFSKPQIKQPPAKVSARPALREECRKKRPAPKYSDVEEDETEKAFNELRGMFRHKPNKYHDDDDSDMEANFEDIMKEEQRSAKIAKKEDEEELLKIVDEERKDRMRKEAKKRKLSH